MLQSRPPTTSPLYTAALREKVSVSGNYYNLMVDGASTSQGSFYMLTDAQKAMLKDGETCTVNGYFVSISKSGGVPKFFNILLTGVESSAKSPANVKRRVATIANTAVSSCIFMTARNGHRQQMSLCFSLRITSRWEYPETLLQPMKREQ